MFTHRELSKIAKDIQMTTQVGVQFLELKYKGHASV